VARVVAPSWNVMVPVGVPEAGGTGVTVARLSLGKEDPARVGERRGMSADVRPAGPLVWIHGASVGEVLAANVALPL